MDGAGIFEKWKQRHGASLPAAVKALPAETIGPAVIRAIEQDLPDLILGKGAPRLAAAFAVLFPRAFETVVARLKLAPMFQKVAMANELEWATLSAFLAQRKKNAALEMDTANKLELVHASAINNSGTEGKRT